MKSMTTHLTYQISPAMLSAVFRNPPVEMEENVMHRVDSRSMPMKVRSMAIIALRPM